MGWFKQFKEAQKVGTLPEVQSLLAFTPIKSLAKLQADILFKRHYLRWGDYTELPYYTALYLHKIAIEQFYSASGFGELLVFAYGVEEGKRLERAKRKEGLKCQK